MFVNKVVLVAFLALSGVCILNGGVGFATANPKPFLRELIFGPAPAPAQAQPVSIYVAPIDNAQYNNAMPSPPTPPKPPQQQYQMGPQNQYQ